MRVRRNEYCPIHRSLFCRGREPIRKERRTTIIRMVVQRFKIRVIRRDIGNSGPRLKCGSF